MFCRRSLAERDGEQTKENKVIERSRRRGARRQTPPTGTVTAIGFCDDKCFISQTSLPRLQDFSTARAHRGLWGPIRVVRNQTRGGKVGNNLISTPPLRRTHTTPARLGTNFSGPLDHARAASRTPWMWVWAILSADWFSCTDDFARWEETTIPITPSNEFYTG